MSGFYPVENSQLSDDVGSNSGCRLPVFELSEVESFIDSCYGMSASVTPLDGERDLNYLVCKNDGGVEKFVFKICNESETEAVLLLQAAVMDQLENSGNIKSNQSVRSVDGKQVEHIQSKSGVVHFCRLTTYLDGDLFSAVFPRSSALLQNLGATVAVFGEATAELDSKPLRRPFLWHMESGVLVLKQFYGLLMSDTQKALITHVRTCFEKAVLPFGDSLARGVIHNDANDNNIVVRNTNPWEQSVVGLIDFGDIVYCWRVTDLAIACAYAILESELPLDTAVDIIKGYHQVRPLDELELQVLFPMIMMRLAMSVSICAKQKKIEPNNKYLSISEKPAWAMLERLAKLSPQYVYYLFRSASGFSSVPQESQIVMWLSKQDQFHAVCDLPSSEEQMLLLDTSISSPYVNISEDYDVDKMSRSLNRALEDSNATTGIGRYDEYRLIYQSAAFEDVTGHKRTLHLGIDIFQPEGSNVYCPLDATVYSVANNNDEFDYGGTVILKHEFKSKADGEIVFFTLYGHLSPDSFSKLEAGAAIAAGSIIGRMGRPDQNGNWPPHVHFQIVTDMLEEEGTFVGVGSHAHREVWLSLCPDPNLILRLPAAFLNQPLSDARREVDDLEQARNRVIPSTLSLSYRKPISIARGAGQYLYDFTGRQYLDAVNNVPHVGHCHPHVVAAERAAAGVLNTNTRYLYRGLDEYAERLLKKSPGALNKVFFVNSGSEANDLALRMAFCHTGRSDVMSLEHGYHGNLGSLIDISGYKHDGPGGSGAPAWVHKAPVPDLYRSSLDSEASGEKHAASLRELLSENGLHHAIAAFICEAIPGCGGQLVLPNGYLQSVYASIREAGGVCIADEVQTGFGRVGSHFWAFETQSVVPDIITLGKPAGNGHPIGAVITTDEIAKSFTNGMEYFNTFGGNPVSCAVGNAVLDVIEDENLQAHAAASGLHLKKKLDSLSHRYPIIGDVRGYGLFLGVELVEDRQSQVPAATQASYVVERMREEGVLLSTDGPWHNVIKIKPPIIFNQENGDLLCAKLDSILSERWAKAS